MKKLNEHEHEVDEATADAMLAREWPGYHGMFSRHQAPGAIPNGTAIRKVWRERGDLEPIGSTGKVLGSLAMPEGMKMPRGAPAGVKHVYWVEWDNMPMHAIFLIDKKIGRA